MRDFKTIIAVLGMCVFLCGIVFAVGMSFGEADQMDVRIVAVVGETPILSSELDQVLLSSGMEPPTDSTEFWQLYARVLKDLIAEELVVQAAEKESVTVEDDRVNSEFSARWDTLTARFGGEKSLADTLAKEGILLASFKKKVKNQVRSGLLKQLYIQKNVRQAELSDADVRKFYEQHKDSLGKYPKQAHILGIFIEPPPDSIISQLTEARAREIAALAGKNSFENLAKLHSDDARTADKGGALGKFNIDDLPINFRTAVASLEIGKISAPIAGDEGFHIVKLLNKNEKEVEIAHIFIRKPAQSKAAEFEAKAVAESLRAGADFNIMLTNHCRDEEYVAQRGDMGKYPLTSLPKPIAYIADSAGAGAIVPPVPEMGGFVVYKIAEIIPERAINLDDHFQVIREMARQRLFAERIEKLIEKLREKIYVEVRHPQLAEHMNFK